MITATELNYILDLLEELYSIDAIPIDENKYSEFAKVYARIATLLQHHGRNIND
jgi:hypothetical protein